MRRKTNEIIAAIFVIAGLILFFGNREWFPDFYNPKFMAVMAFLSSFLIFLPRLIFRTNGDFEKQRELNFLQTVLAAILLLNGLGSLGLFQLYKIGFEYDKLLHFVVPFISVITIGRFGFRRYGWNFKKSIVLAASIVFLGGLIWELFEYFGDYFFETQMLGYYGEFIVKDTVWDLIFNTLGIAVGVIYCIRSLRSL
jgi:hypothetical protein